MGKFFGQRFCPFFKFRNNERKLHQQQMLFPRDISRNFANEGLGKHPRRMVTMYLRPGVFFTSSKEI